MNCKSVADYISGWMDDYCRESGQNGFVVGISGGIDSALCSTLASRTGRRVLCLSMPIHQAQSHISRADEHIAWLKHNFDNVESLTVDLTDAYESFIGSMLKGDDETVYNLTCANTRSRMRMMTLYYYAGLHRLLVVGTGNKIEDFGVGFFTKYGDGGVDMSPIADLMKTEVYELSAHLGVCLSIMEAAPTDGLFGDDRSDEQQIGATYPELEWAMTKVEEGADVDNFNSREREVFDIFTRRNRANRHKTEPIPVCKIPKEKR